MNAKIYGLLLVIIIFAGIFFFTMNLKTGLPIQQQRSDLAIYEVEERADGYLMSVQNNGGGDALDITYGYKESQYYRSKGSYPLIKAGEILTFKITAEPGIQKFKVDIGRFDSGTGPGFIQELDESNNQYLLCIDKDGDGFYQYGKLCLPLDCNDQNFTSGSC